MGKLVTATMPMVAPQQLMVAPINQQHTVSRVMVRHTAMIKHLTVKPQLHLRQLHHLHMLSSLAMVRQLMDKLFTVSQAKQLNSLMVNMAKRMVRARMLQPMANNLPIPSKVMGKLQLLQLLAVEEEATVNKAMASRVVATVPHLLSNNNSSNHLNSPVDMDSRIPMGSSHSSSKAAMVNNIVIVVAVMGIITNRVAMVVLLNSHHLSSHLVVMVDLHQRVMEIVVVVVAVVIAAALVTVAVVTVVTAVAAVTVVVVEARAMAVAEEASTKAMVVVVVAVDMEMVPLWKCLTPCLCTD